MVMQLTLCATQRKSLEESSYSSARLLVHYVKVSGQLNTETALPPEEGISGAHLMSRWIAELVWIVRK
jgi:hypothetical protein